MATTARTVQSIERAFAVLELVAAGSTSLADVTGQVDLPKSTVARLLATLEALKAVERDDDGAIIIGPRVRELAGGPGHTHLRRLVQPHLERLADQLGEATGLAVPAGPAVRNVSQVESPMPVQVRDYTGLVVPAHIGSPGLAYMATWPTERVDSYLARPLEAYTASTVTDPTAIRDRLERIRTSGWAYAADEFADGISSIAAVVVDRDELVVGTLHAHGPTYRFPPAGLVDQIGDVIARSAASVLGHAPA